MSTAYLEPSPDDGDDCDFDSTKLTISDIIRLLQSARKDYGDLSVDDMVDFESSNSFLSGLNTANLRDRVVYTIAGALDDASPIKLSEDDYRG